MPALRANEPLAPHTTFFIGGSAEWFLAATSVSEVQEMILYTNKERLSLSVIGGGSNILVPDEGVRGVVMRMDIVGIEYEEKGSGVVWVRAGAGVQLDDLVADTVLWGLWGLENLSLIPGTVGATPIQNVGAYGVEVSDCVVSVEAVDRKTGEARSFTSGECDFSYRNSFFKTADGSDYILTHVTFALSANPRPRLAYAELERWAQTQEQITIEAIRSAVITIRQNKFPDWHKEGTAGSFFKNPIISKELADSLRVLYPELPLYEVDGGRFKCALGFVLDKICNLRGYREGNVRLYEKQALVLVADRGATAAEVKNFAEYVTNKVKAETRISVEWEVTMLK